jgi:hypothetical protein
MKKILSCIILASFVATSCNFFSSSNEKSVTGNHNVIQVNNVIGGDIKKLLIEGISTVFLVQDLNSPDQANFEIDENLFQFIDLHYNQGSLSIKVKKGFSLKDFKSLSVTVHFKNIESIRNLGVGRVISENGIKCDSLWFQSNGVGDVVLKNIETTNLDLDCKASGNVEITGQTQNCIMNLNSLGSFEASKLKANIVHLSSNACGNIQLDAEHELYVLAESTSTISYTGNAIVKNQNVQNGSFQKVD